MTTLQADAESIQQRYAEQLRLMQEAHRDTIEHIFFFHLSYLVFLFNSLFFDALTQIVREREEAIRAAEQRAKEETAYSLALHRDALEAKERQYAETIAAQKRLHEQVCPFSFLSSFFPFFNFL